MGIDPVTPDASAEEPMEDETNQLHAGLSAGTGGARMLHMKIPKGIQVNGDNEWLLKVTEN
jgi:hypothetical protein